MLSRPTPLTVAVLAAALLPAATAQAAINFAPAVSHPTGGSFGGPGPAPVGAVAGDFDRDGRPDVALVDPAGNGPLVMRNRGGGAFDSGTRIAAGSGIQSLAAGHLDGDGALDLVAATSSEAVVLPGNGDGTFRAGARYPVPLGEQVQAIVVDANRDGVLDIAAITQFSAVRVLLGRGDATFTTGPLSSVGGGASAVAAASFDFDGIPDLAVADGTGGRVIALRGNGDGSFTPTGSGIAGGGPEDVKAADFNGDGRSDVVTADSFSFTDSVLLANGLGGFGPATRYPGSVGPVSIAIADFDRDGRLDFTESAVGSNREVVYAGNGNGTFTAAGEFAVTNQPQTPVVADFDGDGRLDVAVPGASNQLSVLRNLS
jgi:hypothetical protein